MKRGLSITNFSWRDPGADLAAAQVRFARATDQGGLDAGWAADHLLQADSYGARPGETEMVEAYTTGGALMRASARSGWPLKTSRSATVVTAST